MDSFDFDLADAVTKAGFFEEEFNNYWSQLINKGASNAGTMHDRERRAFRAGWLAAAQKYSKEGKLKL